jgi:GAF domain-containing protein
MLQDWIVRSGDVEVIVEAEGWLEALAVGPLGLGVEREALARLACTVHEDGRVLARDAVTGLEIWLIPTVPATPAEMPASSVPDPADDPEATEFDRPAAPPPAATLTDDVLEDLFLRLGELSSAAGIAEASAMALRIVLDLVPAGAGAVLIRTRSGDGLRFRATSGPAARKLVDTVIPLERGVAGYVCQFGIGLAIADARRDGRHDAHVDRATGFTTRALLAVPVRADSGAVYGVLELLNPPRAFTDTDLDLASRVAGSLGALLASVDAVR